MPALKLPTRPAVLMLHGAGGGGWEWNLWRARFEAEGHLVRTPDLQPSPAGVAATRLDDYRAQAEAALRQLAQPAIVIGASLGGLLALQLAARHRCAALVLVNPLPPAPEARRLPPRQFPPLIAWRSCGRFESTRKALPDADEPTRLFAFRHWRDESGAVLTAAWAGVETDLPDCPRLLLLSEHDEDVSPTVSSALATRLAASLIRVPGSHVGPLLGTSAAATVKPVIGWIRRVL